MSLAEDLKSEVGKILAEKWTERDGAVVPESADIGLGNDCTRLDAAVLYADIRRSTDLVDKYDPKFAAEVYKSFLHCAAKIVRSEGGVITAYDGDRIMAVWLGKTRCNQAVTAALRINYARANIILPAIRARYSGSPDFTFTHTSGVDTSRLLVARTGVRGANDLVWVGRAANHAARMCELPNYSTRISNDVFIALTDAERLDDKKAMIWTDDKGTVEGRPAYGSNHWLGM
ncbi:MAG: adenylate/guanylate cyclase domain-containing protein [Planctomycetota bacterium]